MNCKNINWPIAAAITLAVSALIFIILDVSLGTPAQFEAEITGKYYKPPETRFHTDSEGFLQTTFYSEEFRVTARELEGDGFDISVPRHCYSTVTTGEIVMFNAKRGRWTGWRYTGGIQAE